MRLTPPEGPPPCDGDPMCAEPGTHMVETPGAPWDATYCAEHAPQGAVPITEAEATKESAPYPALHACLSCGRHPSTHAPATPDSDDGCPMCGLGDAIEV